MSQYIVAGIGTGVGKTVISAMLCRAFNASYWKPIQAGDLDNSDSIKVNAWLEEKNTICDEQFCLNSPLSPHLAAQKDNIEIRLDDFVLPLNQQSLIVELAGGIMVPLNYQPQLNIDLIAHLGLPVILVSNYYLGSINHTLLSISQLKQAQIDIAGIIFNGFIEDEAAVQHASREVILNYAPLKVITEVPHVNQITPAFINEYAEKIRHSGLVDI